MKFRLLDLLAVKPTANLSKAAFPAVMEAARLLNSNSKGLTR